MINISPIGRNCSHPERDEFEKYDLERGIRAEFVRILKEEFKDLNLTFSIGGQVRIFSIYRFETRKSCSIPERILSFAN